jgi:hypothetical protein
MKLIALFLLLTTSALAEDIAEDIIDPLHPFDVDIRTGPDVGKKIPAFCGKDQDGKTWDFDSVKGPKGAVILFYRSAGW